VYYRGNNDFFVLQLVSNAVVVCDQLPNFFVIEFRGLGGLNAESVKASWFD